MKAILLSRVSTVGQDFTAQSEALQSYARSLGFTNLFVIEDKESGVKLSEEERNGLNQMKQYLHQNPDCKNVFIWEISRLARTEKVLHSIKEWLVNNGIQLHMMKEGLTLLNADGSENSNASLIFTILGNFASQEVKTMKARFTRGKARNKELGKYNGGKVKFGYEVDESGRYVESKDGELVRLIYDLYATGEYSISKLTEELKKRGYNIYLRAVTRILQDNCYTGQTEMHYPQLVSAELWKQCRDLRYNNTSKHDKTTTDNVAFARKIMRCECGYNYSVRLNKIGFVYSCAGNTKRNMSGITPKERCTNRMHMSRDWLDCILWYVAKPMHEQKLTHLNHLDALKLEEQIAVLEQYKTATLGRLNRLDDRRERVEQLFEDGDITRAQKTAKLAQIKRDEVKLREELTTHEEAIRKAVKLLKIATGEEESPTQIKKDYSLEDMDKVVKSCINKVELERLEKHNKITLHLATGGTAVYLFKRSSKKEKIYNEELQPLDDEILSSTKDYWREREKERC